jgi:hypothetical protein
MPEMDDSGLPDEDNVFLDMPCSPSEGHMSDEEIRIYRRAKHVMLYVSLHVGNLHDDSLIISCFIIGFFLSFFQC